MSLFDTEDAFLTKNRLERIQRFKKEENPFRMLGGAMETWNAKNNPEVLRAKQIQSIVKDAGMDQGKMLEAAKKLIGNGFTEEGHEMINRAAQVKQLNAAPSKTMYKDAQGYNRYQGTNERVNPQLQNQEKETAGYFRSDVTDNKGVPRKGLFKPNGELVRYLGSGEKTDNTDGLQAKTFLLPNGSYESGSYDKNTGKRYVTRKGSFTEAPEGTVDVNYRVQKEPKLSDKATDQLIKKSSTLDSYLNLVDGFKNDFGGYKLEIIGDAVNSMKKKFGDESGQALWWQQHDMLKNKLRHELFGSALTKTEKVSFDKITIDPGQHPSIIRANLAAQLNIAKSAAEKLVNVQREKGIPDSQVRSAVGETVWTLVYPSDAENITTSFSKSPDGVWRAK